MISDEEELASALTAIYYQRTDDGLETPTSLENPNANFDNEILEDNCVQCTLNTV